MQQRPRRRHTEVLRSQLELEGRRIADIGCGAGSLVRYLSAKGARAIGIDPQEGQLNRARAADPEHPERYIQAGAEALPLENACLDAAIFFNALHHLPLELMDRGLAEARRALKAGGLLYVLEPLAEGAWFRYMAPVDDETFVRAKAEEALQRAAASPGWKTKSREEYLAASGYASFEELKQEMLAIDPTRAEAFARHEDALRRTFDTVADEILEDGTRRFWSPFRLTLLEKAGKQ